ncbi:MAG: type I secretion C-terminal target domain-containing protein [Methylophilaceae bacterium]
MENLGRVVLINGQADADNQVLIVKELGGREQLQLNDVLALGDTIITPKEITVDVQLANGELIHIPANQVVKITSDLAGDSMPDADDSAVHSATINAVIQATDENRDFIGVLDEVEEALVSASGFGGLFKVIQDQNPFQTMFDHEQQLTVADGNSDANNLTSIPVGSRGGVLDLRDLLTDDAQVLDADDLAAYLHFEVVGEDTVVHINNNGSFSSGEVSTQDVHTITLAGIDLVNGFDSDHLVIESLLANNKLIVD